MFDKVGEKGLASPFLKGRKFLVIKMLKRC